jgi:hypothetical protein
MSVKKVKEETLLWRIFAAIPDLRIEYTKADRRFQMKQLSGSRYAYLSLGSVKP